MRYLTCLLCSFVFLLASCATAPKATSAATATATVEKAMPSYAGTWEVTVNDTPMGTVTGDLMLTESEAGLSGTYVSGGTKFPLKSVKTTDGGLYFTFYYADQGVDVDVDLEGAATATMLKGQTMGQFITTAKRKE